MGVVKKIVNGTVVEVDVEQEDPVVKTIENGVVVEKRLSQIKKKDDTSPLSGIGAKVASGVSITIPKEEKSGSTGLLPSGDKPSLYKPGTPEEYNRRFEEMTGHKDLNLGSDLPQISKAREEKKYQQNRAIEETELKPLFESVHYGTTTPKQLADLYNKPYGKKLVADVLGSVAGVEDPFAPIDEKKWADIDFAIKQKNRVNLKTRVEEIEKASDEYLSTIKPGAYTKETLNLRGDTKDYINIPIEAINYNDAASIGNAMNSFKKILVAGGKDYEGDSISEKILPALDYKLFQLKRKQAIGQDIEKIDEQKKIDQAIMDIRFDYFKHTNEDPAQRAANVDEREISAVKRGLEYFRDADPGLFNNAMRTLADKAKMDEGDYAKILSKGQQLENENIMIGAAANPELIDKETKFVPQLASMLKARQSTLLGETAKQIPFLRGKTEFSDTDIDILAANTDWAAAGVPKPTKAALDAIKLNENRWFYDEIPKSGLGHSLISGLTEPLYSIAQTIEDWTSGSTATDYLRSKQLDRATRGSQMTVDEKGELGQVLPSDKGNIFFEMVKGAGSFITQMALTELAGAPLGAITRAGYGAGGASMAIGTAANTAKTVSGVAVSSYLQGYASAYEETLQNTGDPTRAVIMGTIGGTIEAATEQLLVETKVGSKIFKNLTGNVSNNIYNIIRSDLSNLDKLNKISGVVKSFLKSSSDVFVHENFEEVTGAAGNRIAKALVTPEVSPGQSFLSELGETIHGTTLSMAIPSILSGVGGARSRFNKNVFNSASLNIGYTESVLKKQVEDGTATQDEYNQAMGLLKKNLANIILSPKVDVNGKPISKDRRQEYGFQQTIVQVNEAKKKELEENGDQPQAKLYDEKIKAAREVQKKILGGEVAVDTATEVAEKPEVKAINDKWKQNIVAIEERTDISDEEKEKLKAEEDNRHATEMAELQKDDNRDASGELNEKELAAVEALTSKDYSDNNFLKLNTDVLKDPHASVEDKRMALQAIHDQLTDSNTAITMDEQLKGAADAIYDLGYETMDEKVKKQQEAIHEDKADNVVGKSQEGAVDKLDYENAKKGDVVLYHGEEVTVGDKDKRNDGKEGVQLINKEGGYWVATKENWDEFVKPQEKSGKEGAVVGKVEMPSSEQQLKDAKEGNLVTFTYKSDAEVPEIFKDKISSRGEVNGEQVIRVTIPKSLADYHLAQEQSGKVGDAALVEGEQSSAKPSQADQTQQKKDELLEQRDLSVKEALRPKLSEVSFSDAESLRVLSKGNKKKYKEFAKAQTEFKKQLNQIESIIGCIWGKK